MPSCLLVSPSKNELIIGEFETKDESILSAAATSSSGDGGSKKCSFDFFGGAGKRAFLESLTFPLKSLPMQETTRVCPTFTWSSTLATLRECQGENKEKKVEVWGKKQAITF